MFAALASGIMPLDNSLISAAKAASRASLSLYFFCMPLRYSSLVIPFDPAI